MDKWQEFLDLVEKRLEEKGLKAAAASRLAVGNPFLIYNLRKGHKPTVENLERLCEVLELDYTIGAWGAKSEKYPPSLLTSEASGDAGPGLEPVRDRQLAEILAIIADHYERENDYGRQHFIEQLKAHHPALFARGGAAGPGRRLARLESVSGRGPKNP